MTTDVISKMCNLSDYGDDAVHTRACVLIYTHDKRPYLVGHAHHKFFFVINCAATVSNSGSDLEGRPKIYTYIFVFNK